MGNAPFGTAPGVLARQALLLNVAGSLYIAWTTTLRRKYAKALGDHRKLGERCDPHFFHHAVPMRFDGSFGRAQLARNLLVHLSPHHALKDLTLARAQVTRQGLKNIKLLMLFSHAAAADVSALDRLEQSLLGDRLRQQVFSAGLHDTHGVGYVGKTRHKNNRN